MHRIGCDGICHRCIPISYSALFGGVLIYNASGDSEVKQDVLINSTNWSGNLRQNIQSNLFLE